MNTLKEILLNGGYVTSAAHAELKDVFPNLAVCVKWGAAPRQNATLGKLDAVLDAGEARGDYVREVFVPVSAFDKLREALGITEEDQRSYYQELAMQQNLSGLS
jgi:hypothetical protein